MGLLADEENVDGTEVKVVEERERCKTVVGRVLAGVELRKGVNRRAHGIKKRSS